MNMRWRKRLAVLYGELRAFVSSDPWAVHVSALSWPRRRIVQGRRILRLTVSGFREDNCPLHAAALTYNTLLALIPIMAVGLWIFRGVGAADIAQNRIMESIQTMPDEFQAFIGDMVSYVENTDFATLGGVGLLLLLWMAVNVLGRVESSFNKIWAVESNRSFLRKSADYISILVVVPLLIVTATTINTAMASEFLAVFFEGRLGISTELYRRSLSLTPWLGAWMALMFMNIYIPNTRVRVLPGLVSGLIGGSLWVLWQLLYLRFQFGIAKYNAIYGTFASIPIFLAWVYISWQIVLLSAEIAFSIQNCNTYKHGHAGPGIDLRSRFLLMLAILSRTGEKQSRHDGAFDAAAFAESHTIPARMVNETVAQLVRVGYLVEVARPRGAVVLLRSPDSIMLRDLAQTAMELDGTRDSSATSALAAEYQDTWRKMHKGLTDNLGDATLGDFIPDGE